MLALWYLGDSGVLSGYYEHLATGKKYKYAGEIASLPLYFGILSIVIGAWQWFGSHKEGHWDYYSSTVAGGMFILLIAMLVRWFVAPEIAVSCMFIFPIIGNLLGMSHVQFGAWAGTGILNSAQVAGAALAFQPDGIETLKVAEIFNITRVLVLPIIVLWLAVWYVKREEGAEQVNVGRVIFEKFPMFVVGFILMFALSTTGIFSPANHYKGKFFGNTTESGFKEKNLLSAEQQGVLESEFTSGGAGLLERHDRR